MSTASQVAQPVRYRRKSLTWLTGEQGILRPIPFVAPVVDSLWLLSSLPNRLRLLHQLLQVELCSRQRIRRADELPSIARRHALPKIASQYAVFRCGLRAARDHPSALSGGADRQSRFRPHVFPKRIHDAADDVGDDRSLALGLVSQSSFWIRSTTISTCLGCLNNTGSPKVHGR